MPNRIPVHRPPGLAASSALYERMSSRRADIRFYQSVEWRAVRGEKLRLDPLCEDCDRAGRTVAATEVHHVLERKQRPDLALDVGNLESCCTSCHNRKRRKH